MTCLQLCILFNFQIRVTFSPVFMNIFFRSRLTLYKCVVSPCVQRSWWMQNWTIQGVIMLVISNRPRASRSSDFEINRSITPWIVLHSVQLLLQRSLLTKDYLLKSSTYLQAVHVNDHVLSYHKAAPCLKEPTAMSRRNLKEKGNHSGWQIYKLINTTVSNIHVNGNENVTKQKV